MDTELRLTHVDPDFYVDVTLRPYESTWIATADLGEGHDLGMSMEPREAIKRAPAVLGERYWRRARDCADGGAGVRRGTGT